jgi:hypothetical protein
MLALFCALLAAPGCQHAQDHRYTIGIYGVPSSNDLATVAQAGFNTVMGPAEKPYLDAAGRLNLNVLASPGTSAGKRFAPDRARRVIAELEGHPALWAWYLADEPDRNRVSPADVKAAQRQLKSFGARKPTALALFQGGESANYGNIADVTMIDRYPIPWLPLANFPQHVRMARLAVGKEKPLIAVIQAFDWRYYPTLLPGQRTLRPPTYEELRCMTYCALAREATGLFYYCFNDGAWSMRDHPQTWDALRKVIAEVNQRLPLFQAEHRWWPYFHEYPDPAAGFNEALESSVIPALLVVHAGNSETAAGQYLLTVNTTGKSLSYRIRFPEPVLGAIPVIGESRSLTLTDAWLEDKFGPFDVHIYGPIQF